MSSVNMHATKNVLWDIQKNDGEKMLRFYILKKRALQIQSK